LTAGIEKQVSEQKYLCSNPNCRNVFAKPKIIKYHVCPNCQTLVTASKPADDPEIQAALTSQKSAKPQKPKTTKRAPAEVAVSIKIDESQVSLQEQNTSEQKDEDSELSITPNTASVQVAQPNNVELIQPPKTSVTETRKSLKSSSECEYGFGYLSQRNKGEAIPKTCVECPKSLDCMLSRIYEKDQSVKEIKETKKWYSF
jgi:hypothetical protein